MKEKIKEFLGMFCNLYIVALLVALPLYTGKGYWQLGDTKYMLFRNLSFLCLGSWLVVGMPGRVCSMAECIRMGLGWRKRADTGGKRRERTEAEQFADEMNARRNGGGQITGRHTKPAAVGQSGGDIRFSRMDGIMVIYGGLVVISAACSSYRQLAWSGYEGWYMGALSQILFVGIYFFVSRQYDGAVWPVYLGETAFFLVTLLGLLHRLGIDPLGLMTGWNSGDWEYSHMMSTLGNINWLCGYYSVALAFITAHYLRAERRWLQAVLYLVSVSAFVLLLIQGSQGGLLILGVCAAVCFFLGRRRKDIWRKTLLLFAGTFFSMPLMEKLMKLRGDKAAIAADGNIFAVMDWYGWMLAAVICLFLLFLSAEGTMDTGRETENRRRGRLKSGKGLVKGALWAGGLAGIVLTVIVLFPNMSDGFGSGRGFLWRIAVESFGQAEMKDKLIGAGPDCYAEAVFHKLGTEVDVWKGEHWEGAVFTNAHNEILSQLCNIGILGTVSYVGIFLAGLARYCASLFQSAAGRGEQSGGRTPGTSRQEKGVYSREIFCGGGVGILALMMYGVHSLISFQQVLNTPLLFLVLGLCEAEIRGRQRANT